MTTTDKTGDNATKATQTAAEDSTTGFQIQFATSGMINNGSSTLETIYFVHKSTVFDATLGMMIRVLISGMIFTTILNKAPFMRELKIFIGKR